MDAGDLIAGAEVPDGATEHQPACRLERDPERAQVVALELVTADVREDPSVDLALSDAGVGERAIDGRLAAVREASDHTQRRMDREVLTLALAVGRHSLPTRDAVTRARGTAVNLLERRVGVSEEAAHAREARLTRHDARGPGIAEDQHVVEAEPPMGNVLEAVGGRDERGDVAVPRL